MDFKDKVVMITGASSGIGRATAQVFAQHGANLVVSDIRDSKQEELIKELEEAGAKAIFCKADVSDYEQVSNLMHTSVKHFGKIDIAVNNAGIGPKQLLKTGEHTLEDWNRVIAVNQTGVFYCMQLELQQMLKTGGGCIVNVASAAGLKGLPNNVAYTASKHAVVGMTKTAAIEYARKNIRVNAVCPYFTHTPMFDLLLASKEGLGDALKKTVPVGRFGEPEEVANTILWLSASHTGFITGQAIAIDGGASA